MDRIVADIVVSYPRYPDEVVDRITNAFHTSAIPIAGRKIQSTVKNIMPSSQEPTKETRLYSWI